MTNKLEQMLEKRNKIIKKYDVRYFDGSTYAVGEEFEKDLNSLITEVWNEAIKECEGCVPGKLPEVTLQDSYALERNIAHNSCREQTLQAISKMYENKRH